MLNLLRTLNDEQKKAVTSTEGAWRLMAGAGSGKTKVFVTRMAHICQSKEIAPNRVLCLTYTNKAAKEMAKRASDLLGRPIKDFAMLTFHSLAKKMIERDYEKLGYTKDWHIGNTALTVMVKQYVDRLIAEDQFCFPDEDIRMEFQKYLGAACHEAINNGTYVDMMTKSSKPEEKSIEKVLKFYRIKYENMDILNEYKVSMNKPFSKDHEKRTIPQEYYKEYFDGNMIEETQKEYLTYCKNIRDKKAGLEQLPEQNPAEPFVREIFCEKQNLGTISYDDMLNFALYLLKDEEIRQYWQNQFDYIQIDEFQDTDEKQFKIAMILVAKHGNLFAVGDADQSIYRFRGAEPKLFVEGIKKAIPELKTITLNSNYRSKKAIVEASNQVISLSRNRLERTSNSMSEETGTVTVLRPEAFTPDDRKRVFSAIDQAQGLNKVGKKTILDAIPKYQGNVKDTVDLFIKNISSLEGKRRSNYDIDEVINIFKEKALSQSAVSVLVKELEKLIKSGASTNDIAILYRSRKDPMVENVYNAIIEKNWLLDTQYEPKDEVKDMAQEAIDNYIMWNFTQDDGYLAECVNALSECDEYGNEYPLNVSLNDIKEEKNPYDAMLLCIHQKFHVKTGAPCGLYGKWLNHKEDIKKLVTERTNIFASLTPEERDLFMQPEEEKESKLGIHLYTMHKAKGLEWKYVFVLGLDNRSFPSVGRESTMIDGIEDLEEQNRLAYVAFSRAKENLYLCVPGYADSPFVAVLNNDRETVMEYQKTKMYKSVGEIETVTLISPDGKTMGYAYKTCILGERIFFVAKQEDVKKCPFSSGIITVPTLTTPLNDTIKTVLVPKEYTGSVFGEYADTKILRKLI